MSLMSDNVVPITAENGCVAVMKAAWRSMPTWKRWWIGSSVSLAGLVCIGLMLISFIFVGGAATALLGAGLSIGAGITNTIAHGYTAKIFFKQGRYLRCTIALIGYAAGLLT